MADLRSRIGNLEAKINKFDELHAAVSDSRITVEQNEAGIDSLMAKVDDTENRSRRNNLVFFGVEDNDEHERVIKSESSVRTVPFSFRYRAS